MPLVSSRGGFSLAEILLALAVMATACGALLPAIAQAGRLQRASELQTAAAIAAAARLERLKGAIAAGVGAGGSMAADIAGWHAWLDREGRVVDQHNAVFLCRWSAAPAAAPGLLIAAVWIEPRGATQSAITFSTAVRHE